jgi:hypothetical protein
MGEGPQMGEGKEKKGKGSGVIFMGSFIAEPLSIKFRWRLHSYNTLMYRIIFDYYVVYTH